MSTSVTGGETSQVPPAKKRRKDRPKKRKFAGNRYTGPLRKQVTSAPEKAETASSQKLTALASTSSQVVADEVEGYRFWKMPLLVDFVKKIRCQSCDSTEGYHVSETRRGLMTVLKFTCVRCEVCMELKSSDEDVNVRYAASIFNIGCHYQKGKQLLCNMNIPPPVTRKAFDAHRHKVAVATATVANESMLRAAKEFHESEGKSEVVVSCDGTWQRRGFVSKNGVATVLSVPSQGPAKVLDVHVASNHCDACAKAEQRLQKREELEKWRHQHKTKCMKNHEGTAGSMESEGMTKIFRRSQSKYGLKYTGYLGDGDSKSYHTVARAQPPIYEGKDIQKLECCGHVQKRMGKRLLDKVAEKKNVQFQEGGKTYRGIGGKAGLTKIAIKKTQGHYGAAVRNNAGDLAGMRKAVWAIWKHRGKDHSDCGEWCPSKRGNLDQANAHAFPQFVLDIIKPVFTELSRDDLLKACLHGGTQNTNESLHNMIWSRCPKTVFVSRERVELAVNDAVITFNEGGLGRLAIFPLLGLSPGRYTEAGLREIDATRVQSSFRGSTPSAKAQRQKKRLSESSEKAKESDYKKAKYTGVS